MQLRRSEGVLGRRCKRTFTDGTNCNAIAAFRRCFAAPCKRGCVNGDFEDPCKARKSVLCGFFMREERLAILFYVKHRVYIGNFM